MLGMAEIWISEDNRATVPINVMRTRKFRGTFVCVSAMLVINLFLF
jgi:hypothetical protein